MIKENQMTIQLPSDMIRLPCYGMILKVVDESGWISSDLTVDKPSERATPIDPYYAAVDGIESMVLAHACAGIDVTTTAYIEGIETAVEAVADEYGDT